MAKSLQEQIADRARQSKAAQEAPPSDPANKSLDREFDAQFSLATHSEDVALVALNRLRPFSKHPFKAYSDDRLNALADSIARDGLHQPIIVRKIPDAQGWEILAGHNRVEAMRKLGKSDIPAIIRDADDDQAVLIVVNTNLAQREKLLPSEKAFAYKLQMEAIKNGGNASDGNGFAQGAQIGHRPKCVEIVAGGNNTDRHEIQRYIRLTLLLPTLLDLLDQERLPVMAGYELSFLDTGAQEAVLQYLEGKKLTLKHAEAIRTAFQSGKPITVDSIPALLQKPKKKPGPVTYRFSQRELKKRYTLPDGFDFTAFIHEKLQETFG
jgi:ParB family chromosome partitioning protein